jgi:DNA-binding winged helix-turn-helix (wHTH) protein/predicted ATPase
MRVRFGDFELDGPALELRHGDSPVPLQPKVFDLLVYLIQHRDRVVLRDELLRALWPGVTVGGDSLNRAIRGLRRALGERSSTGQFVCTIQRRGYRFVADLEIETPRSVPLVPGERLVGRARELERLAARLEQARRGERQTVFVMGEAGIGKTALVESFLAQLHAGVAARTARGACAERIAAAEPYRPFLEALASLGRGSEARSLAASLERSAPTWLAEIPWLAELAPRERDGRDSPERSQQRMPRELCAWLEAYTQDTPLILVLEDLHWGDPSSIALALDLARRSEFARVLVIATLRPSGPAEGLETLRAGVHALRLRDQADEIALSPLATEDVVRYLEARFALGDGATRELAPRLHARTDGNALFLVTLASTWIERGLLVRDGARFALAVSADALFADLPDTLRETLSHEIERHGRPEQALLEAASAIGLGFSAALVAAGVGRALGDTERSLDAIVQRGGLLCAAGRELLPDGSHSERYAFRHELVREVLNARLEGPWRVEVNRRIGVALEHAFGPRAAEVATDLARHFDAAEEPLRAAHWYEEAARVAIGRFAYQEAESVLRHALGRLECAPPGVERDERELRLRLARMTPLLATRGYGSAEVETNSCLAERLVSSGGSVAAKVLALGGLWSFRLIRGELAAAENMARRSVELADLDRQQELRTIALLRLGTIQLYRGDLERAREAFGWVVGTYDPERDATHPFHEDLDPGVTALAYLGWIRWLQGDDDGARARSDEALALARRLRRPHSQALALCTRAGLDAWRDDPAATHADAQAALELSARHGFVQWSTFALALRGWARARQGDVDGGIAELELAIGGYRAAGARLSVPYFLALEAGALMSAGRTNDALRALSEARSIALDTGERYFESELQRLHGELTLAIGGSVSARAAEGAFREAVSSARALGALGFERRAAASLASLCARSAVS